MKGRLALWAVAAVLTVAVVGLSLRFVDPFPPTRIVLATGQPGGAYDDFGREYQRRLAREGLRVDLRRTAGSVENLERLLRGEVDVAFVQGGTYPLAKDVDGRLRGMAALYREPLWIFYRGKPMSDDLGALAGRRIAVGAPGSGTEAIARALLEGVGLPTTGPNLLSLPAADARGRLESGAIDAAFFVSSYRDANVAALLHRPDVRLLSFQRDAAFGGNFRYLSAMRIPPGLLDLKAGLPREPITLMAPAALLVCRETLHPRAVEQILTVAQAVHGTGSLLDPPGRFPTREGVDVPLHDAADSYLLARGVVPLARAAVLGAPVGDPAPRAPAARSSRSGCRSSRSCRGSCGGGATACSSGTTRCCGTPRPPSRRRRGRRRSGRRSRGSSRCGARSRAWPAASRSSTSATSTTAACTSRSRWKKPAPACQRDPPS